MNTDLVGLSWQPSSRRTRFTLTSLLGGAGFAAAGFAVVAALSGAVSPQNGPTLSFDHGQTITVGSQSLDLSKPVFVKAGVCPRQDQAAATSPDHRRDCAPTPDAVPANVVTIAAARPDEPVFEVQMDRPGGAALGWVDLGDLEN
jgi:hypothetical protein